MRGNRFFARLTVGLGIASLIAIGLCHLALTDIRHGEGDLTTEWSMLQIGFLIILLFHASVFFTLVRSRFDGKAQHRPDRS